MKRLKIISAVGARPNFIKLAPFIRQLAVYPDQFRHYLVHTGQHYDVEMSRDFFTGLGLPDPDVNLEVGSGTRDYQISAIEDKFTAVCRSEDPDWVVVFGDVNSTLACSTAAKKLGIKIAHVEAGLRSFDETMPEELNRRMTDAISDLLFTHSREAEENLRREGVGEERICPVGNIMIDTLVAELPKVRQPEALAGSADSYPFIYATLHRPSNVDDPCRFRQIIQELQTVSARCPVLFAVHPRTARNIASFGLKPGTGSRILMTGPLSYHESLYCVKHASVVITDSGGLQEESAYLGTPCLTVRPNTERPVTIRTGVNRLTSPETLAADAGIRLDAGRRPDFSVPENWDGRAAERIVGRLLGIFR